MCIVNRVRLSCVIIKNYLLTLPVAVQYTIQVCLMHVVNRSLLYIRCYVWVTTYEKTYIVLKYSDKVLHCRTLSPVVIIIIVTINSKERKH